MLASLLSLQRTLAMAGWEREKGLGDCIRADHGLGRVGSRFFSFWWFWLGWVQYSKSTRLQIWKDCVSAFKAQLDKIWLHQAVKFVSCIGLGPNFSTWVGLGQSADGLGWIGSHKVDPWTTLDCMQWRWRGEGWGAVRPARWWIRAESGCGCCRWSDASCRYVNCGAGPARCCRTPRWIAPASVRGCSLHNLPAPAVPGRRTPAGDGRCAWRGGWGRVRVRAAVGRCPLAGRRVASSVRGSWAWPERLPVFALTQCSSVSRHNTASAPSLSHYP